MQLRDLLLIPLVWAERAQRSHRLHARRRRADHRRSSSMTWKRRQALRHHESYGSED
jgi:ribosomal protein L44E